MLYVEYLDVFRKAVNLAGRNTIAQRCLSDTIVTDYTVAMIPLKLQIRRLQQLRFCQRYGHFNSTKFEFRRQHASQCL